MAECTTEQFTFFYFKKRRLTVVFLWWRDSLRRGCIVDHWRTHFGHNRGQSYVRRAAGCLICMAVPT